MRKTTLILAALALGALPALAQQRVDERRPAGAAGTVEVINPAGSVRVVGWNRPEVRVTGELGRGTERLDFESRGDRVVVRVVLPRGAAGARGSDLEVYVPAGRSLRLQGTSTDAAVAGVEGAVDVSTVSGDVRVEGRPRTVDASSRSGAVFVDARTQRVKASTVSGEVRVAGAVRDEVEVAAVSGDVEVRAPAPRVKAASVSGDVRLAGGGRFEANSVSGDVEVTGRGLRGSINTVSGDMRIAGEPEAGGRLELQSHSGTVSLELSERAGAEVNVTTFSGEVVSTHPAARLVRQESRRERRFVVGRGGADVSVSTFSGDVKLSVR